ncbi:hypothetical protein HYU07_07095 [Candidatus Woesearchaeota archaeon]|nr:hypothetical protein [Candidatus Woesearchaeota archaeon]
MASIALNVSEEFKASMDKLPWVNWSELAREEALKRLELQEDFEEFNRIVSKSKLTEEDALKLAREVNKGMHKKLKKLYPELL